MQPIAHITENYSTRLINNVLVFFVSLHSENYNLMNMKRLFFTLITVLGSLPMLAQGWPSQYEGVMLQGFYWDSFSQSQWVKLEKQADELSQYFSLVWLPQSANCGGTSMGYDDLYWFPGHYDSSFGSEAELRSLIKTFKDKGIGTIADVVINHRKNVSNWVDFPKETYNGVTYELKSTDICSNDDGGKTKTWATQNGYSLSSNTDTGEGWDGMRDLDHKSENVQTNVKAYLKMLLEDLGYVGFRYDMVKGYSAAYTKIYNEDSKPKFSVGECWDGSNTIKNWIDGTGKTSAAFDFQFRYTVRNAANNGDWRKLIQQNEGNWPLVSNSYNNGTYKQWAVTFVENHDTEKRSNAAQDPIKKALLRNLVEAQNAFGPCNHQVDFDFLRILPIGRLDVAAIQEECRTGGVHLVQAEEVVVAVILEVRETGANSLLAVHVKLTETSIDVFDLPDVILFIVNGPAGHRDTARNKRSFVRIGFIVHVMAILTAIGFGEVHRARKLVSTATENDRDIACHGAVDSAHSLLCLSNRFEGSRFSTLVRVATVRSDIESSLIGSICDSGTKEKCGHHSHLT